MNLQYILFLFAAFCLHGRADFLSLNILDYGATPSGSVDDAPAFQAAMDDLYKPFEMSKKPIDHRLILG